MASTFTTAIGLEKPARGDDVGTWDTPVNGNMNIVDAVAGQTATISLNNSPVVLSAAQFQCSRIVFNSTLTGSVSITFPTSFTKGYTIHHTCTGSSAFTIQLLTTAAGGQIVGCPPGDAFQVWNDGTHLKFVNLGRVGSFCDYVGTTVPNWVSASTIPPYLNCNGGVFSSVTYPQLAIVLGGTTLPNSLGRFRGTLNQGSGNLTTSGGFGIDGNTNLSLGGNTALNQNQLPNYNLTVNDVGHSHGQTGFTAQLVSNVNAGSAFSALVSAQSANTQTAVTGITVNSAGAGLPLVPPAYIAGITMIRAA